MPAEKRPRLSKHADDLPEKAPTSAHEESQAEDDGSFSEGASGSELSPDTEDDLANPTWTKSKQTLKRKRRATDVTRFGVTLQALLNTDAPSSLPLSLKPSIARKHNDEKLEWKGKKVLEVERKVKEEKGRIKDVIGGWGGEGERGLRKVAQRGVVKLFNVIQQSQSAAVATAEELKTHRGSGKPTLPAPTPDSKSKMKMKGKNKDNPIGRGKETVLEKDDFLDIIRSGGIVSKA